MNRTRQLLLTLDYEIFGNGSGDVRQHIVDPTERMARICERFEVPLTIFFEAEEYLAFCRNARDLEQALGYDPARLIREQVRSLVSRGHDFQLHLHPEWYDAKLVNRYWLLQPEKRTVDSLFETIEETDSYVADRKQFLENISGRPVAAYRAGAFSAQPGNKLLYALAASGITIDSSVVKGLVRTSENVQLDYRRAPAKPVWRVSDDVAVENAFGGVWEVPIYSVMGRRLEQLTWRRLRAKFSRNVPRRRQTDMLRDLCGGNIVTAAARLFEPVPIKLDYHNLSPRAAYSSVKSAPTPAGGEPNIITAIGHTKEHVDDDAFAELLRLIKNDRSIRVVDFSFVAELLGSPARASEPVALN